MQNATQLEIEDKTNLTLLINDTLFCRTMNNKVC